MSVAFPPPLGTLLDGRYRLYGLLGAGGMSTVYEGEDLRLTRRVAVKVLRPAQDDEALGERQFREARAAARSDHPAVITVYGFGRDEALGLSYVAMERLTGETLAHRIARQGALSPSFVAAMAQDALDALDAVHSAQVVHRDLKPSNIFLATRGRRADEVKLLDFGVARMIDLQTLTVTGEIYGTPLYMAPEQLRDSRSADARSDLYSLGVLLFECLTGRPPFASRALASLTAEILRGPRLEFGALCPQCPHNLSQLVNRCLRSIPAERPADARQALALLLR